MATRRPLSFFFEIPNIVTDDIYAYSNIYIYRSRNSGLDWEMLYFNKNDYIAKLIVNPSNSNKLFKISNTDYKIEEEVIYSKNGDNSRGIKSPLLDESCKEYCKQLEVSTNSGKNWEKVYLNGVTKFKHMDIDVSQGKIIVLAVGKNNATHFFQSTDEGKTYIDLDYETELTIGGKLYDYPKFVRLIDNTTHILIASSSAIAGGYIDGDRMQIYHMSVN
tara:strand:+ start:36 stop:692 length:657 start_codon:yes stop_codon:yes gene_type:complete